MTKISATKNAGASIHQSMVTGSDCSLHQGSRSWPMITPATARTAVRIHTRTTGAMALRRRVVKKEVMTARGGPAQGTAPRELRIAHYVQRSGRSVRSEQPAGPGVAAPGTATPGAATPGT